MIDGGPGRYPAPSAATALLAPDTDQRLWIPMGLPTLNNVIDWAKQRSRSFSHYQHRKRHLQGQIIGLAHQQLRPARIDHRVFMTYVWVEGTRHPRDPSNVSAGGRKFIEDALVAAWLWDDSLRHVVGFSDQFVIDNDHVGCLVGFSLRERLDPKLQRQRGQRSARMAALLPRTRLP